jgi:hypothetical protein
VAKSGAIMRRTTQKVEVTGGKPSFCVLMKGMFSDAKIHQSTGRFFKSGEER